MDQETTSNSSLDTFVLKCNEQKTEKLTNTTSMGKTIITYHHTDMKYTDISEEIHIEKQESKCSIYINTTVCEQKLNHMKTSIKQHRSRNLKCDIKKSKGYSVSTIDMKNRITPKCFRRACTPYKNRIDEVIRNKVDYHRPPLESRRTYKSDKRQKEDGKKSKHSERRHRHNKKAKELKVFSPISPSPLKEELGDNLTYEDLSTTSFETHAQKPMSYKSKLVKKCIHCGHVKEKKKEDFESKLDTLIRRTKERERKLIEQSRKDHRTWFTSTPLRDCNSEDIPIPCAGLNVSIGSQSTLILENHNLLYSPISSADLQSSDKLSYSGYSPESPNQDYTMKTIENNNNYKLDNVKIEPMMDIGAYSPVGSPDASEMQFQEKRIKNEVEIKTESLFSCTISPIYFEKDTSVVQCCKIESNNDY